MSLTRKHFNRAAQLVNEHHVERDKRIARRAFYEFFRSFGNNFDGSRFYDATPLSPTDVGTINWIEDMLGGADTASLAMDDPSDRRRMAEWIAKEVLS